MDMDYKYISYLVDRNKCQVDGLNRLARIQQFKLALLTTLFTLLLAMLCWALLLPYRGDFISVGILGDLMGKYAGAVIVFMAYLLFIALRYIGSLIQEYLTLRNIITQNKALISHARIMLDTHNEEMRRGSL